MGLGRPRKPAGGRLESRPRARSVEAAAASPAAPLLSIFRGRKDRTPTRFSGLGFWFWVLDDALLSHGGNPTLPSARSRFTAEFGMGSGGSNSLWSSSNSVGASRSRRYPETGM